LRISHVGLRGVVGGGMTAAHVVDFASAFGTFLESGGPVILGRDPRASGVMIREGVVAALLATGHDVVDLGVVSTPVIQQTIRRLDGAGGLSIGASHNTADWNALKFFGPRGTYLSTAEAGELLDIYHLRKFDFVDWKRVGKLRTLDDAIDQYLDELASVYDLARLARFKVLVDCCNGTSSLVLRRMNERFGFEFILINASIEGVAFAHEPATTARTVALQLAPLMRPLGADAGFCSTWIRTAWRWPPIWARRYRKKWCCRCCRLAAAQRAGQAGDHQSVDHGAAGGDRRRHAARWCECRWGGRRPWTHWRPYRPEQIALAGEGTGAVMMPQFRFVYDGIASMLAVLSMMAERDQKLSEMVAGYPRYSILKGQAALRSQRIPALLRSCRRATATGRRTFSTGCGWIGREDGSTCE